MSRSTPPIPRPESGGDRSWDGGGPGVACGVLVGVVCVLSARDSRFAERGVILLFKNVDTGVDTSSLTAIGVLFSALGRCVSVVLLAATTLGVNGALLEAF